ncbi:MAG: hypothetical protein LBB22_05845 [Treponema sp.]|jgi:hypothetical protein|nr:hypothetical protein [Treponema sp.]
MEFAPQRVALLTANSGLVEAVGGFSPLENNLPVYTAAYPVPLLVIEEV